MSSLMLNLTEEQAALLELPVEGTGGFQTFGRKLQSQIDRGGRGPLLTLTNEDIGRVIRYADYGSGGFEGRLAMALGDHLIIKGRRPFVPKLAREFEGLI